MLINMLYTPGEVVKVGKADLVAAKHPNKLTIEERKARVLRVLDANMIADPTMVNTGGKSITKCYPEGDESMGDFIKIVNKGLVHLVKGEGLNILQDAETLVVEFSNYLHYCNEFKLPISKLGFVSWIGCGKSSYNDAKNRGNQVSSVLKAIDDNIASIRTKMADEGKIPTIQHIFEMANSHGYSRSDPKSAVNIEINTGQYSQKEVSDIVGEIVDIDLE